MEVEITLTIDDLKAFQDHEQKRQSHVILKQAMWYLPFFALFICGPYFFIIRETVDSTKAYVLGLAVGMAMHLLSVYYFVKMFLRQDKAFAKDPVNRWFFEPYRLTISPDGLAVRGISRQSSYAWNLVWKIEATDNHCFLYTTSTNAQIVPKRAFQDEVHFMQLVVLAGQFKAGRQTPFNANAPLWKQPPGPTGLFDPESSY